MWGFTVNFGYGRIVRLPAVAVRHESAGGCEICGRRIRAKRKGERRCQLCRGPKVRNRVTLEGNDPEFMERRRERIRLLTAKAERGEPLFEGRV